MNIGWDAIWEKFDEWARSREPPWCKSCGQKRHHDFPDWEEQQQKIEELVEAQLTEQED